jgi:hypothetical protein
MASPTPSAPETAKPASTPRLPATRGARSPQAPPPSSSPSSPRCLRCSPLPAPAHPRRLVAHCDPHRDRESHRGPDQPGRWVTIPGLSQAASLHLAPGDQRVAYDVSSAGLRRTDDAGASWSELLIPGGISPSLGLTYIPSARSTRTSST